MKQVNNEFKLHRVCHKSLCDRPQVFWTAFSIEMTLIGNVEIQLRFTFPFELSKNQHNINVLIIT